MPAWASTHRTGWTMHLAQGSIFETWAHEACFAPMADLALHRSYNHATRRHWGLAHAQRISASQRKELDDLLAHIRTQDR